jgi:LacI family transcriptional regulator
MKSTLTPAARVTMRDIARELGLSHVTVSLALGDNPRIPEVRRRQVKETALRMGYRPDPMLAALLHYRHARKSTPIRAAIAWLNLWPTPSALRSFREFDGYWTGACEVAESHGYHLEEFTLAGNTSFARLEKIFLARNIQGILLPPTPTAGFISPDSLNWSNFFAVCFGHSHANLPFHIVTADQVAAGRLAVKKIAERGYRRIGYVTDLSMMHRMLFSAGFLQAQSALPAVSQVPLLTLDPAHHASYREHLKVWIRDHQPDAIITDLAETGDLLRQLKIKVPKDIGLAALSVLDGKADAGINQNPVEIGRAAAETLISQINHNHRGIPKFQRQVLVEGFWTDGSTMPSRL